MSKILIFTDNHFSTNSSIIRSNGEKYSTRLENQIKSLNWVNQLAIEENCDQMICLGDFFDSPNLTSQEVSALKEVKWNNIPKTFLVGNHEMGSNDLIYNSADVLYKIGKVINKPSMTSGYGYELIYLPYILETNRKSLQEYIEQIRKEYYSGMWTTQEVKHLIILSHNDLKGIQFGRYESKQGFEIKEIESNCDLFINGHLHNQTPITKKIFNLGNLTGQNFSEDGFKYSHSALILDTDNLETKIINNPYAFYFYKIEVNNIEELKEQITKLDKNYSIGSIKISQKYIKEAKELCNEHFKEYRLMIIPEINIDKEETNELTQIDHIEQFKNYLLQKIGVNEILNEELGLL